MFHIFYRSCTRTSEPPDTRGARFGEEVVVEAKANIVVAASSRPRTASNTQMALAHASIASSSPSANDSHPVPVATTTSASASIPLVTILHHPQISEKSVSESDKIKSHAICELSDKVEVNVDEIEMDLDSNSRGYAHLPTADEADGEA